MDDFIWIIVVGLIAGAIASRVVKGQRFGIVGNVVIGVLGALLGSIILKVLFFAFSIIAMIFSATLGAIVLLALLKYWQTGKYR